MKKKQSKWRNSNCLLLGIITYSLLFFLTEGNVSQTFGIIIIALVAFMMHLTNNQNKKKSRIELKDIIYASIGIILDSLFKGFPFDILLK